jgi:hypothetical protein
MILGIVADAVVGDCEHLPDEPVRLALPVLAQESTTAGDWVIAGDERGRWVARLATHLHYTRGDTVNLVFTIRNAFWFDSVTGRTLHAPAG